MIVKRVQDDAWLCGKGDPLGIVQEIKIYPDYQMVYTLNKKFQQNLHTAIWFQLFNYDSKKSSRRCLTMRERWYTGDCARD